MWHWVFSDGRDTDRPDSDRQTVRRAGRGARRSVTRRASPRSRAAPRGSAAALPAAPARMPMARATWRRWHVDCRAAPLRRSGALGSPRRGRAHTRADAPPVPAVIAHGRLEGVGARLHTCAEHPDTMGGQSTAHWAVWVCMGGCPWRAVAGFSPGDRTISFVEDLEEVGLRRCRTPAEPPQHGSPAGSIERGRSRRSAASAGCADSDMRAEAPRQQHNTSTCFDRRAGGAADDGDRLPARAAGGRCENRE